MSFTEMLTDILPLLTGILGALISWLGAVQMNRISEKERAVYTRKLEDENRTLQTKLDKAVHVYRVQFETEFQAFLAVWGKFSVVRGAMAGLRPRKEIVSQNENRQERLARKLKVFADAINELKTAVFQYSPFYPEEVYRELSDVISLCDGEHDTVSIEGQDIEQPQDWYEQGEKRFSDVVRKGEVISSKIRQRIESLSVQQ